MRRGDNAGSNYRDQPEDGELVMRHDEYERDRGSGSYSNVPAFSPRPALADRISSSPSRAERWRMGGGRAERGQGGVGGNSYRETDSHRFEEIPDDDPRGTCCFFPGLLIAYRVFPQPLVAAKTSQAHLDGSTTFSSRMCYSTSSQFVSGRCS
jgi:hypothetical protein